MSIKSDKWIRRMAQEHGMITPFEPYQVKMNGDSRIVSYGTSSYGYDIRCSSEFKIFTNINSAIVDPKNFDATSFVDFKGDVCIIPPNSFALARTVEYFRIPRNVLTICLGKCVTGDTRILDVTTGDYIPIMDWGPHRKVAAFDGYDFCGASVSAFAAHGEKPVFTLRTADGLTLTATASHPLLTPTGYKALSDIAVGTQIGRAVTISVFGRDRLIEPQRFGATVAAQIADGSLDDVPLPIFRATRNDLWAFLRGAVLTRKNQSVTGSAKALQSLQHLLSRFGLLSQVTWAADVCRLQVRHAELLWNEQVATGTGGQSYIPRSPSIQWDTVISKESAGIAPVYDLEVPGLHNFLANGLVIHNSTYARCGIIVNVTPFEPEWEGYVTLEFSNTTPLPAKIYANEGVAQVVFFEADEECETSYKDRDGKYQGQSGVTLPKT